jgi:lipase chaperone LimK
MRTASRTKGSERPRPDGWGVSLLAVALLALLGGAARVVTRAPEARAEVVKVSRAATPSARPKRAVVTPRAAVPVVAEAAPAEPPASLRGTTEDGALRVDEDGHLVIEPGVLRLFDYHLSATGEESAEAIRARVVASIRRCLGEGRAADRAIALYDTYVGYRESTRRLDADGDLGARLDALKALRRRAFGEGDAEKLFGEDERRDQIAIDQRAVLTDPALAAEEREARLAAIDARLPEAERAARGEAMAPIQRRADEEAMRARGASDDEIRAYRVAHVGEEAAERLGELDAQRAAWRERLDAFREARAKILREERDPGAQQIAVKQLLDTSFTTLEQIRVRAADQIDAAR